jgi:membrane protein implicated in regulation of membrane protease activity
MNPRSAQTLAWTSVLLMAAGFLIGSPEAGMAAFAAAALCALAPVLAGPGKIRIAGILLLLASLGLAFATYPAAKRQMDRYMGRPAGGETKAP